MDEASKEPSCPPLLPPSPSLWAVEQRGPFGFLLPASQEVGDVANCAGQCGFSFAFIKTLLLMSNLLTQQIK